MTNQHGSSNWPIDPKDWPIDPKGCVFIGRAIERFGRQAVEEGLVNGTLNGYVRLIGTTDPRIGQLPNFFLTAEGWADAMNAFQVEMRDMRPGVSVRERRGGSQPHWLFISGASLKRLLAPQSRSIPTETEALAIIRDKIASDIKFGRREQDDICARSSSSTRYRRGGDEPDFCD